MHCNKNIDQVEPYIEVMANLTFLGQKPLTYRTLWTKGTVQSYIPTSYIAPFKKTTHNYQMVTKQWTVVVHTRHQS